MADMKAVALYEHGGPEVLRPLRLPLPEPAPGEVRVRVKAAAINHLDVWVRRGGPAFRLEYPHRLGSEASGVVDALGAGVSGWSSGDEVVVSPGLSCGGCRECLSGRDNLCRRYRILGENAQGAYAEYLCVPRENLCPKPANLSWAAAAAGLLTFLTAWQMLVRKARIEPGQTVLVQGGGSGVGTAAIQIARLFGARVLATASTAEKLAKARELGADEVVNYASEDFVAAAKSWTGGRGVDVVIEHVGGETLAQSVLATCRGGRVVTCGATAGHLATLDLRHVFFRQVEILGSTMGSKGDLFTILEHQAAERLVPIVDRTLPLEKAADAHRLLEARQVFGKLVLLP